MFVKSKHDMQIPTSNPYYDNHKAEETPFSTNLPGWKLPQGIFWLSISYHLENLYVYPIKILI